MLFSEEWLRHYINPDLDSKQLCEKLTMGGLEVEGMDSIAPDFHGVVVAQVLTVDQHPNADKLHVCTVDTGKGEPIQIVCGAPNVAPGVKVPCALDGAVLRVISRLKNPNFAEKSATVCFVPPVNSELMKITEAFGSSRLMLLSAKIFASTPIWTARRLKLS